MAEDETKTDLVSIDLSADDVKRYNAFCEHYDLFKYLLDNGVFTHRLGKVVLHYSSDGRRMAVHKEDRSPNEFIFPPAGDNL
jgi:hypothetical protein